MTLNRLRIKRKASNNFLNNKQKDVKRGPVLQRKKKTKYKLLSKHNKTNAFLPRRQEQKIFSSKTIPTEVNTKHELLLEN